jgi:hypothetical protein
MIIDAHCHILPASFPPRLAALRRQDATIASLFPVANPRMATAEGLIDAMNAAGVDRAVVMGLGWRTLEVAREVNDYLIESVDRFPERLTGFCSVNPAWGTAAVTELERCLAAGLRGLGELHADSQAFDITRRDQLAPLLGLLRERGLPVLVHASEPVGHQYPGKGHTTPDQLYRFIENFPENSIICAHWGGGLPFYALMPEVPAALHNVYFDSAASPLLYRPEIFAAVSRLVGANRILFATDYPLLPHRRVMAQLEENHLETSEAAAILGENAQRLLHL